MGKNIDLHFLPTDMNRIFIAQSATGAATPAEGPCAPTACSAWRATCCATASAPTGARRDPTGMETDASVSWQAHKPHPVSIIGRALPVVRRKQSSHRKKKTTTKAKRSCMFSVVFDSNLKLIFSLLCMSNSQFLECG